MPDKGPSNEDIAQLLDRIADLLEARDANEFRIRAYRDGASTIRAARESIAERASADEGGGLSELPGIGKGLQAVIREYVENGRSEMLDRLEAEADPASTFARVPGIGEELANRIVEELHIQTLEELEQAAHDGRLDSIEGFGDKRLEAVKTSLAGVLSGAAKKRVARGGEGEKEKETGAKPSIETMLAVDEEYRRKAAAGELRKIAPNRFNPGKVAWLPVLHSERAGWNFTALFSNTARAHELGMTNEWVVIYYERGGEEAQATVTTASSGALEGKRVVRGRELETKRYYQGKGELTSEK